MNCPKCLGKLEERKIGTGQPIVIDRCFVCSGLWFDKEELSKVISKQIIDTIESEVEQEPIPEADLLRGIDLDKVEIACPRCKSSKKMSKIPSPRNKKVTIDYCEDCGGIWLDAGEYNLISKRQPIEAALESIIDFFRLHFLHIFNKRK